MPWMMNVAAQQELRDSFDRDIREHVLAQLPCSPADREALEKEKASGLLIIYANWLDRLIWAQPRRVHLSDVLRTNPLFSDARFSGAVTTICERIKRGDDLTPHLSRGVHVGYEAPSNGPKKLNRRRDLDLLLGDWGIHHLHLSTHLESDGFVTRTGPLLLGVFQPDDAYLIDIIDHGDWSRESIMQTAVRAWPDAGIAYELKEVLGLARTYTDDERKQLRNAGVNVMLEIDGKVYMSPCGLSTAGTAAQATLRAIRLHRDADEFIKRVVTEPLWFPGVVRQAGVDVPGAMRYKFVFLENGYGVLEQNSGVLVRLS